MTLCRTSTDTRRAAPGYAIASVLPEIQANSDLPVRVHRDVLSTTRRTASGASAAFSKMFRTASGASADIPQLFQRATTYQWSLCENAKGQMMHQRSFGECSKGKTEHQWLFGECSGWKWSIDCHPENVPEGKQSSGGHIARMRAMKRSPNSLF
jgi:hypothetical protein